MASARWNPIGRVDLEDVMRATKALLEGTDEFEPNRSHAATIGLILARAIQQAEDDQ